MVYQINEYDWFLMNNFLKGKQCTIIWYVKDLEMLHVDCDIIFSILSGIDAEYGKIQKLQSHRVISISTSG